MTRSAGPHKDELTDTWAFVCDLGAGPNGKRRQARRRGFKTKREAQDALDRLRVSARDGTFVEPSKITLAAWLERWCDGLATLGRAPGTIESYRRQMLTHVVPALGGVRIVNLSAADLDTLYSRLLATGRRDGRGGLSPRTVRYVHTIVSKALSDAVRKRLLARNPALDADPPSAKSAAPPEMTWWKPDELRVFLTSVASDELGALWRLAAMTGMRRGEVCGLRVVGRRPRGGTAVGSPAADHGAPRTRLPRTPEV